MLCESCGFEIPEGKMYCPQCGHAIQIVPDFEPDIEDKIELKIEEIEGVLSDTDENKDPTIDIAGSTKEIKAETKGAQENAPRVEPSALERIEQRQKMRARKKISKRLKVISFILLIAAGFIIFTSIRSRLVDRYSTHIKAAVDYMAGGDYESAYEEYMLAADKEGNTDEARTEALLGAANALYLNGDEDGAIELLKSVLEETPDSTESYEQLIKIYEAQGDMLAVNELVSSCPVSGIYEEYKDYLTMPPIFEQGGGEYTEDVAVSLSASDGVSDIYYTIDGSIPDENSEIYKNPIMLSEGSYIISASCRNKKGYFSAVVSEEFTIEYELPESPVVSPEEDGKKSEPENITVTAAEDCVIYYTEDGSDPDKDSEVYEGEIPMPFGKSTFKFVCADPMGRMSEVTEVQYDLEMKSAFPPADGVNYLILSLFNAGVLTDLDGHAADVPGRYEYKCRSCYSSGSRIYYMIYESYKNEGESSETGNIYALDFKTLELYRAKRGEDGNFTFEMFI